MLRIMLVDDESNVTNALRRTLARSLQGEDCAIEVFNDPRQALERAGEVDFTLVISDYRMPPMDGVVFLKQFRIVQPDAIRLILSASSDVAGLLAAINEAEIFRYIMKPWDDVELSVTVHTALAHYREAAAERAAAEAARAGAPLSPEEAERRRLEAEEPGITRVNWGPGGAVLLDGDDSDEHGEGGDAPSS
jgi:two-component system, probable response regulator PhcQ